MKRIKRSNLPSNIPVFSAIVLWLLLDRLDAPGWVYGFTFAVLAVVTIGAIIEMIKAEAVDIFKDKP